MRISTAFDRGRTEIMAASLSGSSAVLRSGSGKRHETGSGKGTKEYRAILHFHAKLVDILSETVDPAGFARRLKEKSLITSSKM